MKIHVINTGMFKLDGGAMFGVVPKSMWNKLNPADENNMCSWAMRCLLVETGNKLILIDNGIGDKQDAKFFSHYYLHGNQSLHGSLKQLGFHESDITDVVLTHLHFDHCGGSVRYNSSRDGFETVFSNATYWSSEAHWEWATKPNAREKASFLKENILPIQESGQLRFADHDTRIIPEMELLFMYGHTDAMMLPKISMNGKDLVFMADLLPSSAHVPLPYIMAYDMRPLQTLNEKTEFLNTAADKGWTLFFEHDPVHECASLERTEKGIKVKENFSLDGWLS